MSILVLDALLISRPVIHKEGTYGDWDLHGVGELLGSLGLLGEHRMRRLSDGDAAQRFTDCVAQLFGWRLL